MDKHAYIFLEYRINTVFCYRVCMGVEIDPHRPNTMLTRLSFLKVILFLGGADASQNNFISVLYTIGFHQKGVVTADMR